MGHDGGIPELSWVREGSTALGRRSWSVTKSANGWRWCCCSSVPLGNGSRRRSFWVWVSSSAPLGDVGHDGEIAPLYTSETSALFTGDDGTDLAREVETFFWVWVSALGERQGWRGKGKGEMRKKKYWWEKWHAGNKTEEADTVTVVGSMNSVKNIEW